MKKNSFRNPFKRGLVSEEDLNVKSWDLCLLSDSALEYRVRPEGKYFT